MKRKELWFILAATLVIAVFLSVVPGLRERTNADVFLPLSEIMRRAPVTLGAVLMVFIVSVIIDWLRRHR